MIIPATSDKHLLIAALSARNREILRGHPWTQLAQSPAAQHHPVVGHGGTQLTTRPMDVGIPVIATMVVVRCCEDVVVGYETINVGHL